MPSPKVALDTAAFTVRDEDTGVVYPAEPAAQPGECSAALVLAKEDPPVTCTLRFLMPAAVDTPSPISGVHAFLEFASAGLRASRPLD